MIRTIIRLTLQGLKDAQHHPLSQLMTLGAVGLMVFLAGLFLIFLNTLDSQLAADQGEVVIQVYWRNSMDDDTLRAQWEEIGHLPSLAKYQTYTPEEALNAMSSRLQQSAGVDITSLAGRNPLPPTAIMHFLPMTGDQAQWREETIKYLEKLSGVTRVQINPRREEVARTWREISRKIMLPSICMLSGILALVVGNTVRLSLISRHTEIEILQLVGARNWYIRLPLITTGALSGLVGSITGMILLFFVYWRLKELSIPPLLAEFKFLSIWQGTLLVLIPIAMSILGSWMAVRGPFRTGRGASTEKNSL
jgi:cell division transport system permease protein